MVQRDVESFADFHKDGPYRGENLTIPGMPGVVSFAKVRESYVMDLPIAIIGSDRTDFLDALADLRTLIGSDNLVSLTRRFTNGGGQVDTTCTAEYIAGQEVTLSIEDFGKGIPRNIRRTTLSGARIRHDVSSGLGLVSMRERLRQIGGSLEIDSTTGNTVIRAIVKVEAPT